MWHLAVLEPDEFVRVRILESAGHKQLVEDILLGRLQTGAEVDVERYQLHDLVTLAKRKLAASQKRH